MSQKTAEITATLGIAIATVLGWAYLLTTVAHALLAPTMA